MLPEPISVEVTNVDWNTGEKRRAEVELLDTAGNSLGLIDYEGANISVDWKIGHRYRISCCKVTKGGKRYDVQLAPSKRTVIEPLSPSEQITQILVLGDTHTGRTKHPKTDERINPIAAFSTAINYGMDQNVDAVVHVGDIFHENATQIHATLTRQQVFDPLHDAGIPFYYVRGNHESAPGNDLLTELEGNSIFNLSTTGTPVGANVLLFGIDHYAEGNIPLSEFVFSKNTSGRTSILVLHQTLEQLSGRGAESVDLSRIQRQFGDKFDFVVSGHHHDATRRNWNGVPVMYTGAAEQMSTNKNPTDRIAWLLTVMNGSISYQRYDIP